MITSRIRTIIVDDHQVFRGLLRKLLGRYPGIEVVAEAETAEESLRQASDLLPNLMTVDINLPGMNGFELTRILKEQYPATRVIIISVNGNPAFQREARDLCCPYVAKESLYAELPAALQRVMGGE